MKPKEDSDAKRRSALLTTLCWVRDLQLPLAEKALLYALASRVDRRYSCFPSLAQLRRDSGLKSVQHISRTLTNIAKRGLLETLKRPAHKGRFERNCYVLRVGLAPQPVALQANDHLPDKQTTICLTGKLSNHLEVSISKPDENVDSSGSAPSGAAIEQPKNNEEIEKEGLGKKGFEKEGLLKPGETPAPTCGAEILKNYRRDNPTPFNIVGYWWALKYFYFPKTKFYGPRKLPQGHYGALTVLFESTLTALEAFDLIWWVFENWPSLQDAPWMGCGSSTYPTPRFILENAEELCEIRRKCTTEPTEAIAPEGLDCLESLEVVPCYST